MLHTDGSESVYWPGPWQQLKAVRHCACEDGQRRYVEITDQPDTFFSIPARVRVRGLSVRGFVMYQDDCPLFVATGPRSGLISRDYRIILDRERARAAGSTLAPRYNLWNSVTFDYK